MRRDVAILELNAIDEIRKIQDKLMLSEDEKIKFERVLKIFKSERSKNEQ